MRCVQWAGERAIGENIFSKSDKKSSLHHDDIVVISSVLQGLVMLYFIWNYWEEIDIQIKSGLRVSPTRALPTAQQLVHLARSSKTCPNRFARRWAEQIIANVLVGRKNLKNMVIEEPFVRLSCMTNLRNRSCIEHGCQGCLRLGVSIVRLS